MLLGYNDTRLLRHDVITEFDGTWEVRCFNVAYNAALTVTGNDACMEADGPTELYFCSPIPNYSQQDATFLDLFIFTDALHVSGGSSAHHQEHITVHIASGIVNCNDRVK
jgi:hypothetical protein